MAEPRAAGTLYDLGYQRYTGRRLGRANAIATLAGYSVRTAFGLGRGERAKIVPAVVALLVYMPTFVQVAIAAATGSRKMVSYSQHLQMVSFFLALFAAAQAPELVVADRQQGVLSLYLSRSLRGTDYALAKLVAFVGALLVYTLGPELVLFVGKILVNAAPWAALQEDWRTLGPILAGTTLLALYLGSVGLALASLTARRAYGSAAVIAFFIVLPAVAAITRTLVPDDARRYTVLANPFLVTQGLASWLFDVQARDTSWVARADLPGHLYLWTMLGTTVAAVAVLLVRFRRSDA